MPASTPASQCGQRLQWYASTASAQLPAQPRSSRQRTWQGPGNTPVAGATIQGSTVQSCPARPSTNRSQRVHRLVVSWINVGPVPVCRWCWGTAARTPVDPRDRPAGSARQHLVDDARGLLLLARGRRGRGGGGAETVVLDRVRPGLDPG